MALLFVNESVFLLVFIYVQMNAVTTLVIFSVARNFLGSA